MTTKNVRYAGLVRKAITGLILGTVVGALELWFFQHDFAHFLAAVVAGPLYTTSLVVLIDRLQLAGGKILLGAVSGLLAAIVWWAVADRMADSFLLAAVAGVCFGSAYVWAESRESP